jgi:hypothetical protein
MDSETKRGKKNGTGTKKARTPIRPDARGSPSFLDTQLAHRRIRKSPPPSPAEMAGNDSMFKSIRILFPS